MSDKSAKKTEKLDSTKSEIAKQRALAVAEAGHSQFRAFVTFLRTQGVIGLAVGLVLGGAVTVVVKSLIDNVVMPPIGLLLGSGQGLKGLSWTIGTASNGDKAILHYGTFLNDIVNFIVIALIVYLAVYLLGFNKLDKPKG